MAGEFSSNFKEEQEENIREFLVKSTGSDVFSQMAQLLTFLDQLGQGL